MFKYILILVLICNVTTQPEDRNTVGRAKRSLSVSVAVAKKQCLDRHNLYRKRHHSPSLKYDNKLNVYAQNYAKVLARKDDMFNRPFLDHSKGPYGENLFWGSGGKFTGNTPCDAWYGENAQYNYNLKNPPLGPIVGHFTQMVWRNSKLLGFGTANARSGRTYIVCSYSPGGNVQDQYLQNVKRP